MGDLSLPPSLARLSSMEERLKTFVDHNWPYNTSPVPPREALARAGFVYRGENLAVHCFACNVSCSDWQYGDTAIKKHRDLNPYCPFVLQQSDIFPSGQPHVSSPQPVNLSEVSRAFHPNVLFPEYMRVWPNHELLVKESERLKTYGSDWPHADFIRPEDLARAGFVSLRSGDRVQCIFCRGIVVDWEVGDVPFQEHCRHFPSCPFVRGDKTRNISIKNEIRSMSAEAHRPAANTPNALRGFDICGSVPLNMNSFRPERELAVASTPSYDLNQLNIIEHAPPQFQCYTTSTARTKSFETWPKTAPQYVRALVDAGFFYTGTMDHVKCFQCGGGLKNWEVTDVPDEEHARWHPTCSFVLLNKGKEYIERTKKMKPPVLAEQAQKPERKASLIPPPNANRISDSELDRLMESDVAKVVLDMGMDAREVREALRLRWEQAGYNFPTAESLANAVLELEQRDETLSSDEQSSSTSAATTETQLASTSKAASCSSAAPVFQGLKGGAASSGGRAGGPAEQDLRLCKVCMEHELCIVFLPCGHFVACVNCATSMRDCPLCRATIKGSVRMYWS